MSESAIEIRKYTGLIGICIASFLGCIDLTVVNTIIPAIGREFNTSLRETQWITSVFMIALSAFMVPVGTLADSFGRKKILMWGLMLFGAASLFVGLATNLATITVFRFIQGMGCAILYTVSGAIISYLFDKNDQGKALGILFGINGLGLAIGPIIGGLFAGIVDWRYAFLINIPFIIISFILCIWSIPEYKAEKVKKLDVLGCLFLIIFLMSLVSYFSLDGNSLQQWSLLVIAVIALFIFIRHELKTVEPIVEFHFFRNMRFVSALFATFFLAFFYCIVLLTLPIFFAGQLEKNDIEIGLFLLPATVMFALTSPWVGNRSEKLGPPRIILVGLLLFVAAAALLAFASAQENAWCFIIPLLLFGMGWGLILGPSTLIALGALPQEQAAVAMGTSWTIHNMGGACGIAFAVFLLARFNTLAQGYQALTLFLAGLALIFTCICYFLNRK
ncbi:MFS transporter [Xenorhabdus doucetiae]|uniref:EmrB/QacA subfamily drug resistance transporter n=1 Tax=Xenorhabdus doucetiae TaxID=351671 RepID=A0A068QML7_9GAMM|nr:MFS transporter [Xenorhabdus doucetiae]TYO99752.1 EmrB/QacA subfamily drug resistance transporter [Xenorhabdus doucetiae]CDG16098.1 Major facilitator superfamily (MFS_1) transporter [Xenorhabdus doucetiae]